MLGMRSFRASAAEVAFCELATVNHPNAILLNPTPELVCVAEHEHGVAVTLRSVKGTSSNLANVGNKLFASMGLKVVLDYRHRTMTFFGDCR